MAKAFSDLTEREILALAISSEEDDARVYGEFAERLRSTYPATAEAILRMQAQESSHRHRLIEAFRARFGETIPLISRRDVKGFVTHKPVWVIRALTVAQARREIKMREAETQRFYYAAARRTSDAGIRQLLDDLAATEKQHEDMAANLEREHTTSGARTEEEAVARRLFVLQVVQPGLAGLMDGSVSTLAPVFAAAFATHNSHTAFLVGLAASVGAGISMGFAEALSDDGTISGRGHPWIRGAASGTMTALGGIGHTLPFLVPNFNVATTIAGGVVLIELIVIAWVRNHFMDTPFLAAAFQIIVGGLLVFLTGILIGVS
jgi:rubrerythrin